MKKLLQGMRRFHSEVYPQRREHFEWLADKNNPELMMIACADPRLVPCQNFSVEAGEMFTLRNAGNIVPPYGSLCGEQASIVLGIKLGVRDVCIVGHTDCGAMKGLLNPEFIVDNPAMSHMLNLSGTCADWVAHIKCQTAAATALSKLHIVQQLRNLRTYPMVQERLAQGDLELHGLLFDIFSGTFMHCNEESGEFHSLDVAGEPPLVTACPHQHSS